LNLNDIIKPQDEDMDKERWEYIMDVQNNNFRGEKNDRIEYLDWQLFRPKPHFEEEQKHLNINKLNALYIINICQKTQM
jgi:hypothetical protein